MANKEEKKTVFAKIKVLTRLLWLLLLMLILGVSWIFIDWLNKPGNFPFKKIELVSQLENQKSKELQNVTEKALNGGFFSLNIDQLRADLLARLPWVKSVSVRKVWPDKLLIKIVEHKPVARWLSVDKSGGETETQLLSQQGVVFTPQLTDKQQLKFSHMALLTGTITNAEKILTKCVQINNQLKKLDLHIKQCGMNKRRSWGIKLFLDNEVDIKLGKEKIIQKLERFTDVFSGQLKKYLGSVESADLRYANGFSIKWKAVDVLQSKLTDSLDNSLQNKVLNKMNREQE